MKTLKAIWTFVRDLFTDPYDVAQNADGTWRIVNRKGKTVESLLPSAQAARSRIKDLEWEHWQI